MEFYVFKREFLGQRFLMTVINQMGMGTKHHKWNKQFSHSTLLLLCSLSLYSAYVCVCMCVCFEWVSRVSKVKVRWHCSIICYISSRDCEGYEMEKKIWRDRNGKKKNQNVFYRAKTRSLPLNWFKNLPPFLILIIY